MKVLSIRCVTVIAGLGLSLAAATNAEAAKIVTFSAYEDAHIQSQYPTQTSGSSASLQVNGATGSVALIKFKVSGILSTYRVTRVALKVYSQDAASSGGGVYAAASNWSESAVTYGTRPAIGTKVGGFGSVAKAQIYEIPLSTSVAVNGDVSIAISGSSAIARYNSSEAAGDRPKLIITMEESTTTSSPTPTASPSKSPSPSPSPSKSPSPSPSPSKSPSPSPSPSKSQAPAPSPSASASPAPFTFRPIYEEDQIINGELFTVSGATTSHSIGRSPNGKIYRFEVRYGEAREGKDPEADRAELKHQVDFPVGKTLWLSYSFMSEKGAAFPTTNWNIFGQWHAGVGSPPLAMIFPSDTQMKADIRSGYADSATKRRPILKDGFVRGRWYNIVMRVRFSPTAGKAIYQMWIDGKPVIDDTQSPMGYFESTHNYWKFGIYRERNEDPSAAQFANMEIKEETSTQSLRDRILNPLPIVGQ